MRANRVQVEQPGRALAALVVSRDSRVVEAVQASAAAVQAEVAVVDSADEVRRRWGECPVVLVGADLAARVVQLSLPPRSGVHVVGTEAEHVVGWSVPLQASVVVVPDASGTVTALLADPDSSETTADVVEVTGATGGLGVSSLVAGLAMVASREGPVAVVEGAAASGGLDLLMGAERALGWRWPDLVGAAGHVGDLSGHLPQSHGVDLVSVGRVPAEVPERARVAVVQSLARSHRAVLLDAGRGEGRVRTPGRQRQMVVVGADVRSVLAARGRREAGEWERGACVVRTGPHRRLRPDEVAEALGLPLLGTLGEDSGVPAALEAGEAPGHRRGRFAKDCQALWQAIRPRREAA